MPFSILRVLLASNCFTQAGVVIQSFCASTGRTLDLFLVTKRSNLSAAIRQFQPDIAFLELALLQPDTLRTLRGLHHSSPRIPLILFAPPADKDLVVRCLQAGARDYILEGHMDERTLDRVLHAAMGRTASRPASASSHDPLTLLVDRAGLLAPPDRSLSALPGNQFLVSVILDNLKEVRSASGPQATVGILQQLGQLLESCLRRSDLLSHIAPGHFVMVLSDSGETCLASLRRRISFRLVLHNQAHPQSLPLSISFLPGLSTDSAHAPGDSRGNDSVPHAVASFRVAYSGSAR